jgi:hypothetical protein
MAAPLDRTWYNTLIDDDGSGTTGTIWNKAAVDALMDSVDASLVNVIDKTGVPAVNQVPVFNDADTLRGGATLTHDTQTLIATCGNAAAPAIIGAKPSNVKSTTAVIAATAWSPSIQLNGKAGSVWHLGINDDLAGELVIGSTYGPGSGTAPLMRMTTDGYIVLTNGRLQFPAVANPTSEPSTLDDVRRGTFLPSFTGSGGASGQTYAVREGTYQKIGRMVVGQAYLVLQSVGTISGNLLLAGLPISVGATGGGATVGYWANMNVNAAGMICQLNAFSSSCGIYYIPPTGTANSFGNPMTQAQLITGSALMVSFAFVSG